MVVEGYVRVRLDATNGGGGRRGTLGLELTLLMVVEGYVRVRVDATNGGGGVR